jgi:hypothetical protein
VFVHAGDLTRHGEVAELSELVGRRAYRPVDPPVVCDLDV